MKTASIWYCCSVAALISLIFLGLAWELWLAPMRAGGSMLALKILPLLLPLRGVLRGRIYTYQWATMLILAYAAEGATRMYTDTGVAATLAIAEMVLALFFFAAGIAYIRAARRRRNHPGLSA